VIHETCYHAQEFTQQFGIGCIIFTQARISRASPDSRLLPEWRFFGIRQLRENRTASDDTLAQPGNRYCERIVYARQERGMNDWSLRGETLPHYRNQNSGGRHTFLKLAGIAILSILAICCLPMSACAQSMPTASRLGDLQIGGGFVFASSNYNFNPIHLIGGAAYTTFDKRNHWGGEFNFHQNRSTQDSTVYERTYEIGPRIFLARGPLIPYAKVLYGRGVYNFSNSVAKSVANVAYNMYTFGGGADYQLRRSLNLRVDYEYQTWMSFPIKNLHPNVITIGVAYHFHE
jgi:opacity protein-like surface antigen